MFLIPQNVLQWVKVDANVVNNFFNSFRCIALATVQEEIVNMGGFNKIVEIGVISLGTSSNDGVRREVKLKNPDGAIYWFK